MVDDTIRDEIVLLMRSGDGYFDYDRLSLRHLRNVVPSIGDRLTFHAEDEGLGVYQVEQRYLVDLRFADDGGDDGCFWVVIVDQFHEDHFCELDLTVRAIYRADFDRTWKGAAIAAAPPQYEPAPPPALPKSKRISHKMKDPAFWTPERKEAMRKKREARLARTRALEEREKKR